MIKAKKILSLTILLVTVYFVINAYFIVSINHVTGNIFDGLGRRLSPTPAWLQVLLIDKQYSAGFFWHVFDLIVSLLGFYLAYLLYRTRE